MGFTAEEIEAGMAQPGAQITAVAPQNQAQPLGVNYLELVPQPRETPPALPQPRPDRRHRIELAQREYEPKIAPPLLRRLKRTRTPCGLLLGPSGIGKTRACHWLMCDFGGTLIHARDLGSCERRHGLGQGYPRELETARSVRVLYLDDVGAEEGRDLGVIQEVLEVRYREGLATVVTTGLEQDALGAHLGVPYVRRITEQHVSKRDGGEWPVVFWNGFGGAK
jgi:hypothetical protein